MSDHELVVKLELDVKFLHLDSTEFFALDLTCIPPAFPGIIWGLYSGCLKLLGPRYLGYLPCPLHKVLVVKRRRAH